LILYSFDGYLQNGVAIVPDEQKFQWIIVSPNTSANGT
jgi:hypothetical protein